MRLIYILPAIFIACLQACEDDIPEPDPVPYIQISTDKAVYRPGEVVTFSISNTPGLPVTVRYKYLNELLRDEQLTSSSWKWTPPEIDFRGYMAEFSVKQNDKEQIIGTIAIDVTSDWKVFPRYGFLSKFHPMSAAVMEANINKLSRYHINGIQFYDWAEKYHKPLAGTPGNPALNWLDFANRPTSKQTINGYIALAHGANMKAMFHSFINGCLNDAASDGIGENWYLFKDQAHQEKVSFDYGDMFKSPIFLLNPDHYKWKDYLLDQIAKVYDVYPFDGFHIDQVGQTGTVYSYYGQPFEPSIDYYSLRREIYFANSTKNHVFNFLNNSGWSGTASTFYSDFIYVELLDKYLTFEDLGKFFTLFTVSTPPNKKIVLAAYVNGGLSESPGNFNSPSVLLANAVIFALGGSHVELGEHLLGNEYFPNDNLKMTPDLESRLTAYYDFLTAYENILRDDNDIFPAKLTSVDNKITINAWPPQPGAVACIGNALDKRNVFHLINFTNATTLDWQDNNGIQAAPEIIRNFKIRFTSPEEVKKVWFASPDFEAGASREIPFSRDGLQLSFELPQLEYWSMIVVEY